MNQSRAFGANVHKSAKVLNPGDLTFHNQSFGDLPPFELERLDHGQFDAILFRENPAYPDIDRLPGLNHIFHSIDRTFFQLRNMNDSGNFQSNINHGACQGCFHHCTCKFHFPFEGGKGSDFGVFWRCHRFWFHSASLQFHQISIRRVRTEKCKTIRGFTSGTRELGLYRGQAEMSKCDL